MMTTNSNPRSSANFVRGYLKKNSWQMIVLGLLTLTVAVNMAMLTVALKSNPDLVSDSYYADGFDLKQLAKAEAAAKQTGWKLRFDELEVNVHETMIQLTITDAAGQPCDSVSGQVALYRPSDKSLDIGSQTIVAIGAGKYVLAVPHNLKRGAWQANASLHRGQILFKSRIPFYLD